MGNSPLLPKEQPRELITLGSSTTTTSHSQFIFGGSISRVRKLPAKPPCWLPQGETNRQELRKRVLKSIDSRYIVYRVTSIGRLLLIIIMAAPYVAPAGMDALDPLTAQGWISGHLQPTKDQMTHLFEHIYPELNQVLDVCRLVPRQKYAILRQGVTNISDIRLLGNSIDNIRDTFKHFNSLSDARGGTNFGALHYMRIHALTEYVRDRLRRLDQEPVAGDFTEALMNEYISKSEIGDMSGDTLDVPEPPKLGENNFHQWEEAVLAQLRAKKGNLDIPLAYVVRKPTPPTVYVDDTERLVYEAIRDGPGWDQDKKTVGNYIIGLLSGSNAKTWIKSHLASQDGSAMMASLRTHFLGTAQVERIVEHARKKRDKAVYRSQAVYSFERFSTDLQEAFTLLGEYDVAVPEAEQIRLLREKIKTDKADFNAAVITTLMDGTITTFADAVARVSQYVDHFFPAGTSSHRPARGRASVSSVNLSQIAQETRGDKFFYNNLDITDLTRRYSKDEWMKIKDLWPQIQSEKDRKKPKGSHSPGKKSSPKLKTLQKKLSSLSKKISALQTETSVDASDAGASPPAGENNDAQDEEATGPRAFGKKRKGAP